MTQPMHLVAELEDLKLLFRVLSAHVTDHPELLDAELFQDIRARLERAARMEGVLAADAAAFARWLGAEPALEAARPTHKPDALN